MYKKAMSCLLCVNILFLTGFVCIWGMEKNREIAVCNVQEKNITNKASVSGTECRALGIMQVAASGQRVVECEMMEKKLHYDLDEEEIEILCRIVEAEAGTEDVEGKLLVANVVLNRVESELFPDTISEVVFQKENGVSQFSPVSDGRFYEVEISEDTILAVGRALEGENISEGALYFAARKYADCDRMRWFDENLTLLFRHGGHEFFR